MSHQRYTFTRMLLAAKRRQFDDSAAIERAEHYRAKVSGEVREMTAPFFVVKSTGFPVEDITETEERR